MRAFRVFVWAIFLVSPFCHAAVSLNVSNIVCAGNQVVSDNSFLSMACTGDFSISGGSITSDVGILISSNGALNLNNLSIVAPSVEFSAGTTMNIGSGISITANSLSISTAEGSGTPTSVVAPGASISLGGAPFQQITAGNSPMLAVPEPFAYLTMIAGLLLLVVVSRIRATDGPRSLRWSGGSSTHLHLSSFGRALRKLDQAIHRRLSQSY